MDAPEPLLLLCSLALCAVSGVPGLFLPRDSRVADRLAAVCCVLGSALGLFVAIGILAGGAPLELRCESPLPGGPLHLAVDALSAAFLVPIFVISALGAVYALEYWPASEHPESARRLRFFYGFLAASMALAVVSRNGLLFLFGWELMALSAFFALTAEDHLPRVRSAGWVYLIATHTGTLLLFAMVALLGVRLGSLDWTPLDWAPGTQKSAPEAIDHAIFVLAFLGFGFKAGMVPLHFWLPGAHGTAPSHVSAIMSGVVLKMGIYGLLRVTSFFPEPAEWWGVTVLLGGVVTVVLGMALAAGQGELKRLLAYSSVENIGVVLTGLGLALLGQTRGQPGWAVLGLAACIFHVWNHSLFKPLLFYAAGAVLHSTGQRAMDAMGGPLRELPATGVAFAIGSVSAAGLPPFNGFVSEWLLYVGLFTAWTDSANGTLLAGLAIPALALAGALAVASFVRAFGIVFLGARRTQGGRSVHEVGLPMRATMSVLAVGCVAASALAPWLASALDVVVASWSGRQGLARVADLAPLGWLASMAAGLVVLFLLVGLAYRRLRRGSELPAQPTWDCGYAQPTARMQYTSRSFGEWLSERLLPAPLQQTARFEPPQGLFPASASFDGDGPRRISAGLRARLLEPWAARLERLRRFQRGGPRVYLSYILVTLLLLLGWSAYRLMYPVP